MSYRPREGGGSVFALRFPIVFNGKKSSVPKCMPAIVHDVREKKTSLLAEEVIVVDDNSINTKVMCALLKRENNVPIALFSDGFGALQFLLVRRFCRQRCFFLKKNFFQARLKSEAKSSRLLVLLDNTMPGLSGLSTAKLWRAVEKEG